ncbi:hypothetical protein ACVILH_005930 [Bradyrhizobium sp. USDA 4353]
MPPGRRAGVGRLGKRCLLRLAARLATGRGDVGIRAGARLCSRLAAEPAATLPWRGRVVSHERSECGTGWGESHGRSLCGSPHPARPLRVRSTLPLKGRVDEIAARAISSSDVVCLGKCGQQRASFLLRPVKQPARALDPAALGARADPDSGPSSVMRAQGMPGAGRTHGPPARKKQAAVTTGQPRHPGIPCAMGFTLIRALLGDRLVDPVGRGARQTSAHLDLGTGRPGPRDFTYVSASLVRTSRAPMPRRPPHCRPNVS